MAQEPHAGVGITVRRAAPTDVPAIARFQTECWNEAYRGIVPQEYLDRTTVADREVRWASRIQSRDILLAERDGALSAVASTSTRTDRLPGPRFELNTLYVSASERGRGLGAWLLAQAVEARAAVLWVYRGNVRAIRFYLREGFAHDGYEATDPDTGIVEVRMSRGAPRSTPNT